MAYCVHCGVKLGDSEKRCPLCGTVVLDPMEPRDPQAPRPYPVHTPEQELKKSKRYLLTLAALMLLLPALLCLMIDFLIGGNLTWSLYAASALALLFLAVAAPLMVSRHRVYFSVAAAFVSLNLYLYLVERFSHSGGWFFPIALPSLALIALMLTVAIVLYRRDHLNKLTLLAAIFGVIGLECLAIEMLCARAAGTEVSFAWSLYAAGPCLFISLALFLVNSNRSVREELRRRVHF